MCFLSLSPFGEFLLEFARSPLGFCLISLFDVGFIFSIVYTIIWWHVQEKKDNYLDNEKKK